MLSKSPTYCTFGLITALNTVDEPPGAAVAVKHGLTVVHGPITIRCPAVNVTLAVPFTVNPLAAVIVCSALNELVPLEIVIFGNTKFVGVDVDNVTVPHALSAAFAWLIAVTVTVWLAAIVAGAV